MDIRTNYPASLTSIITMEGNNKGVINQNNNIIDLKLKYHHPTEETFPEPLQVLKCYCHSKLTIKLLKLMTNLEIKWNKTNTSTTITTKQ